MPETQRHYSAPEREYAVRRSVLEEIPFPIGYGVETSHLIDVHQLYGMSAFAQTDLDQRVHRNQQTRSLGRMSFGILQTFLSRLQKLDIIGDLPPLETILRQFQVHDEQFEAVEHLIIEEERPPMLSIPAYQEKIKQLKKTETKGPRKPRTQGSKQTEAE